MGAAQPLNSTIEIFRRVRTLRDHSRHTTVKHLTTPFDSSVTAIPGEETEVLEYRDSTFKTDSFRFGHPIVVAPRAKTRTKTILDNVTGVKLVSLPGNPREVHLEKTDKNADFYAELAAESEGTFVTP
jgi:hypothetical protein